MNRATVRILLWLLLALVLGLVALAADGQGLPDAPHRQRVRAPLLRVRDADLQRSTTCF